MGEKIMEKNKQNIRSRAPLQNIKSRTEMKQVSFSFTAVPMINSKEKKVLLNNCDHH